MSYVNNAQFENILCSLRYKNFVRDVQMTIINRIDEIIYGYALNYNL